MTTHDYHGKASWLAIEERRERHRVIAGELGTLVLVAMVVAFLSLTGCGT
jgi:hypothetical protein